MQAFFSYGVQKKYILDRSIFETAKKLVGIVINQLVKTINRGPGTNQWKLQKIVDLFHIIDFMEQFGPADGFNAGTGERGLKGWAKAHVKHTQRSTLDRFNEQIANRVDERALIR